MQPSPEFHPETVTRVLEAMARAHRGHSMEALEAATRSLEVNGLDLEAAACVRHAMEQGTKVEDMLRFLMNHLDQSDYDERIGLAARTVMIEGMIVELIDGDRFDLQHQETRDAILATVASMVPDDANASLRNAAAIAEAAVWALCAVEDPNPNPDHISLPLERAARAMVEHFAMKDASVFVDALRAFSANALGSATQALATQGPERVDNPNRCLAGA